jgi:hypothetical protein
MGMMCSQHDKQSTVTDICAEVTLEVTGMIILQNFGLITNPIYKPKYKTGASSNKASL